MVVVTNGRNICGTIHSSEIHNSEIVTDDKSAPSEAGVNDQSIFNTNRTLGKLRKQMQG